MRTSPTLAPAVGAAALPVTTTASGLGYPPAARCCFPLIKSSGIRISFEGELKSTKTRDIPILPTLVQGDTSLDASVSTAVAADSSSRPRQTHATVGVEFSIDLGRCSVVFCCLLPVCGLVVVC